LLEIDKEKLNLKYNSGDMEYFFIEANKITDYVLSRNFNVRDEDKRADMVQECLLNLWKKVKFSGKKIIEIELHNSHHLTLWKVIT